MQTTPHPRRTENDDERSLADALHLIARGSADEKVRFIAERDPDWFVDHVLNWESDYVDRDELLPPRRATDRDVLDQAIARIVLRARVRQDTRYCA